MRRKFPSVTGKLCVWFYAYCSRADKQSPHGPCAAALGAAEALADVEAEAGKAAAALLATKEGAALAPHWLAALAAAHAALSSARRASTATAGR